MAINPNFPVATRNYVMKQLKINADTKLYRDPKTDIIYRPLTDTDKNKTRKPNDPPIETNILIPFITADKVHGRLYLSTPGAERRVLEQIG